MSKELEALKKLMDKLSTVERLEHSNEIHIVVSALKQKEKLEKVWKIVKEKKVNVQNFIKLKKWISGRGFEDFTYHLYTEYFSIYGCGSLLLTKTEFNLLMEVIK